MNSEQKEKTNIETNKNESNFVTPNKNKHIVYTMKSGDNLWSIAKNYPGISAEDIKKINGFSDDDLRSLKVGQLIIIKNK